MAHSSPRSRTHARTILYVAPTDGTARSGAETLARTAAQTDPDLESTVQAVQSLERLQELAPTADCVVIHESSEEEVSVGVLEVVSVCGPIPLVLFTDASYASAVTRSAEGIDGYVRRGTEDAVVHLADEISKVCHNEAISGPSAQSPLEQADQGTDEAVLEDEDDDRDLEDTAHEEQTQTADDDAAATADETDDDGAVADTDAGALEESVAHPEQTIDGGDGADTPTVIGTDRQAMRADPRTATALLETTARIVDCRDRELLFGRVVEGAVGVLGFRHCWLSTVHFGELVPRAASPAVPGHALESTAVDGPLGTAFKTGQPTRIDDVSEHPDIRLPIDGARSLCSVPVGDIGVIRIVADTEAAFDDMDVALLQGLCNAAAAVLQRNWDEMGVVNARSRLEREVDRLESEREQFAAAAEQLASERDRIAAERDQLLTLVEDVAKPTLRYDIADGQAIIRDVNEAVEAVFGDDPDAVRGQPVEEYVVPDGLEERAETLADALAATEQYQILDQRDTVEGVRDFMLTIIPLEQAADAPAAADCEGLLVYDDITESKRRELELAAANARLERVADLIDDDLEQPLSAARNYRELAAKTGSNDHFAVIAEAHEQLEARLEDLEAVAAWDDASDETEPIALQDVARRAWTDLDTGSAQLVAEDDLILEADRAGLRELFEYVLDAAIDADGEPAHDETTVTITVGATDDGFYVAGDRPTASESTESDGRQEAPTPGRLTASDGAGVQLGLVERIADQHGWDVGVAEDEDGTAFAFRGVDAISVNRNRV
ncbi:GAF domain-containing protein [Natronolimnobius sp. AArcel1]|uniref:GAF domain-containing protein n=1 Tax=Natronolimnobius sp. AArcel1 TaxID=1679093 RepID=UPI0013EA1D30|nr:GAF domain-containing protein [Natronolimnobius sp. AArcel1]NGM68720.1 GAF domain-containing protein [Natronolimnobius sp. AArcel1]